MALLNDNDLMLKAIFAKYSEKGIMKKGQFILMISKLSQRIKELEKLEIERIEAVFYLVAGDSVLDFGEFERPRNDDLARAAPISGNGRAARLYCLGGKRRVRHLTSKSEEV